MVRKLSLPTSSRASSACPGLSGGGQLEWLWLGCVKGHLPGYSPEFCHQQAAGRHLPDLHAGKSLEAGGASERSWKLFGLLQQFHKTQPCSTQSSSSGRRGDLWATRCLKFANLADVTRLQQRSEWHRRWKNPTARKLSGPIRSSSSCMAKSLTVPVPCPNL